jgi:hypothetical protein
MQNPTRLPVLLTFACLPLLAESAAAVTVIADNFDNGTVSADWDAKTGNTVLTGGADGTPNAVALAATTGTLGETFTGAVPGGAEDFVIDYSFRVQASAASRQFSLLVSAISAAPSVNQASINLRYQAGAWGVFNSTSNAFVAVPGLPVITAGSWYHMQVEGVDWGLPTASYTLRLSNAGGSVFTSTAANLTSVQNGVFSPITANKAQSFVFNTAFGTNPGFDLDNISVTAVPEPTASLLAVSGVLLLARRRR